MAVYSNGLSWSCTEYVRMSSVRGERACNQTAETKHSEIAKTWWMYDPGSGRVSCCMSPIRLGQSCICCSTCHYGLHCGAWVKLWPDDSRWLPLPVGKDRCIAGTPCSSTIQWSSWLFHKSLPGLQKLSHLFENCGHYSWLCYLQPESVLLTFCWQLPSLHRSQVVLINSGLGDSLHCMA